MRIGAVSNPLMPILRGRELRFMLGTAGTKVLIVPDSFRGYDHADLAERVRKDLASLEHVVIVRGDRPGTVAFDALNAPQSAAGDGWFATGDLARIDADGYVQIAGRGKDIIVRGGENLSSKEIEDLLFGHPDVAEVAIVAMPDPRLSERACAVVVPRAGASLGLADLVEYLAGKQIARQKHPERLEIVTELPKTPTGKVQKFRLREYVAERLAAG